MHCSIRFSEEENGLNHVHDVNAADDDDDEGNNDYDARRFPISARVREPCQCFK